MGKNPETTVQSRIARDLAQKGYLVIRYQDKVGYPDLIAIPSNSGVIAITETAPRVTTVVSRFLTYADTCPIEYHVIPVRTSTIPFNSAKVTALAFPPNSNAIFWEVKQPGGKPEKHQEAVLTMLNGYGIVKRGDE